MIEACTSALALLMSLEDQVAEYVRHYPYQQTYEYAVRYSGGDPARLNKWAIPGEPRLMRAGQEIVPRTNHDTYYQAATVWLGDGPVVVAARAPSRERFNSFQLIDERNVNYRNVLYPSGEYTLYFGRRPERVRGEAIAVPSRLSVIMVRVEVKDEHDPADVAAAKAVMNGMAIEGTAPAQFPKLDPLSHFSHDVADEAHRRMDEAFATIPFRELMSGSSLHHAALTKHAYGAPDARHSAYEIVFMDERGDELRGSAGRYRVTISEPPVKAFWSVTVYDRDRGGFLHPNAHHRYHFNGTTVQRNGDGTMTFNFQLTCDAMDMNCLEVPAGKFEIVTRYYVPEEPILTAQWRFPQPQIAPR